MSSKIKKEPPLARNSAQWRGEFVNAEINTLHALSFRHQLTTDDWWAQVNRFSLGWVCVRRADRLVGFVNVAWDGGVHAFILDTMVLPECQRKGIATNMIKKAVEHARNAGCEWLHVDFEPALRPFYFGACGFQPTTAGLIPLR